MSCFITHSALSVIFILYIYIKFVNKMNGQTCDKKKKSTVSSIKKRMFIPFSMQVSAVDSVQCRFGADISRPWLQTFSSRGDLPLADCRDFCQRCLPHDSGNCLPWRSSLCLPPFSSERARNTYMTAGLLSFSFLLAYINICVGNRL